MTITWNNFIFISEKLHQWYTSGSSAFQMGIHHGTSRHQILAWSLRWRPLIGFSDNHLKSTYKMREKITTRALFSLRITNTSHVCIRQRSTKEVWRCQGEQGFDLLWDNRSGEGIRRYECKYLRVVKRCITQREREKLTSHVVYSFFGSCPWWKGQCQARHKGRRGKAQSLLEP